MLNIDFEPLNGHVSWTDRPINYYFHKIDRTLVSFTYLISYSKVFLVFSKICLSDFILI